MMAQETIRDKIELLHNELGMTYSYIGEKCGLTGSMISLFVKGERRLSEESTQALEEFIYNTRKVVEWL